MSTSWADSVDNAASSKAAYGPPHLRNKPPGQVAGSVAPHGDAPPINDKPENTRQTSE